MGKSVHVWTHIMLRGSSSFGCLGNWRKRALRRVKTVCSLSVRTGSPRGPHMLSSFTAAVT